MRCILLSLCLALFLPSATAAQDVGVLNTLALGSAPCTYSTGSGAPSGGSTCDVYLDTATGNLWTKLASGWAIGSLLGSSQSANTVLAGPSSGSAAAPTFRALVTSDVPTTLRGTTFTGDLLPSAPDTDSLGSATAPWKQSYISQINGALFALQTQTLVGGWLDVTKNAGTFPAAVASTDTTIDFGTAMVTNQFVLIRALNTSGSAVTEYLQVGSHVSGTIYNVTRNLSGAGAQNWPAGTAFAVLGVAGDGRIELDAFDPARISFLTQGSAYNNSTETMRLGDLSGMPNSASGHGIYAGDATNYFEWDGTNLTIHSGGVQISSSAGTISVAGGNALFGGSGAYQFRRATASGYGTTGDQYALWSQSINSGFQIDTVTLDNTMVTSQNGTGFSADYGRAITVLNAKGMNVGLTGNPNVAADAATLTLDSNLSGSGKSTSTLAADKMVFTGALDWQAFTPTLTASTGTWTVGSGSIDCNDAVVADVVNVQCAIDNTTLSAAPTTLTFTVPVAPLKSESLSLPVFITGSGWVTATVLFSTGSSSVTLALPGGGAFGTGLYFRPFFSYRK